jgi:hypothetical protein
MRRILIHLAALRHAARLVGPALAYPLLRYSQGALSYRRDVDAQVGPDALWLALDLTHPKAEFSPIIRRLPVRRYLHHITRLAHCVVALD